jgi:hypothetical protein
MTNLDTIVAVYSENPGPDIDWPALEAAEGSSRPNLMATSPGTSWDRGNRTGVLGCRPRRLCGLTVQPRSARVLGSCGAPNLVVGGAQIGNAVGMERDVFAERTVGLWHTGGA